jgi:hypothetical protein
MLTDGSKKLKGNTFSDIFESVFPYFLKQETYNGLKNGGGIRKTYCDGYRDNYDDNEHHHHSQRQIKI